MFERFEQLLAAALGGAASVSADRHQHDRLAGKHPADSVLDQATAHPVAFAAFQGEPLQLLLRHARVVLEFQGFQRSAIACPVSYPSNEQAFSGVCCHPPLLFLRLPMRQNIERVEAGAVQIDLQLHRFSLR